MELFKSAVILAGGKSTRMKFDKQLLCLDEKRIIYSIADKLKNEFEDIIIVSNKPEYYNDSKYKVVSDEIKLCGPLGGIHIGLKTSISKYVYFIACDMPNVDLIYIRHIKNKIKNLEIDACLSNINGRIEPFHGFYNKSMFNDIKTHLYKNNRKSILGFLELNNKKLIYINDDEFKKNNFNEFIFINLNTPKDLDNYIKEMKIV